MSTVIIGGGDDNKKAIAELEQASLNWTDSQRAEAEAMLRAHSHRLRDFIRRMNAEAV